MQPAINNRDDWSIAFTAARLQVPKALLAAGSG
jgi:hypothetical protein